LYTNARRIKMIKETNLSVGAREVGDEWFEDVDAELPSELRTEFVKGKQVGDLEKKQLNLGVRKWPEGQEVHFKAALIDTLAEVFSKGAEELGEPLLPPAPQAPLDGLRYLKKRHEWSEPVANLEQPLWLALAQGVTRHLGIEYKLVVKINTRWGIAPSPTSTPRELLTSFGMNPQDFSLYTVDGVDPLPPDTPLSLKRGDHFEAQKDGKYGSTVAVNRPPRGLQTIEDDIELANEAGQIARLITQGSQKYVEISNIDVPSPPWGKNKVDVLVAVPATYPSGGLDAFYLGLPCTHSSNSIPRQQQTVSIDGRDWALISWHYHDSRPWNPSQDDLVTHIQHCKGFFLTRGVRQ
jgi:hypothetical protein